jgi:dihydroxyacid dehydratase/phosphogluconate dehydratase
METWSTPGPPIHAQGGIAVLTGSLAPKGAVVKVAGIDQLTFVGTARVFDGEDRAMEAILAGSIEPGTVVVIRYEGPKGGPGMREMLAVTGAMKGVGRGGTAPWSPTAGSPVGPTASASDTSPPRPWTAAPSPWWPTVIR